MTTNIGLGYEAQLVGQVLQRRLIGATSWSFVDYPVTAAKYRLDGGGTYVRLQYIGDWSYTGGIGPSGGSLATPGTAISPSFVASRTTQVATDWTSQSAAPNIPVEPGLGATFEGPLNLTGNQIVNVAASTTSTGAINQQQLTDTIAAVQTPIEVAIVNGAVTNAIGVLLSNVTIDASNATHTQVTINLGTTTNGKRRKTQGFRLINGVERDLIRTDTRFGEAYTFVFLKTSSDGSSSVNLLLN